MLTLIVFCNFTGKIFDAGTPIGNAYCGYSLPRDVIVIPYNSSPIVDVVFKSDVSFNFEGFAIKVGFDSGRFLVENP